MSRGARIALWLGAGLLALLLASTAGLGWLAATPQGLRWALSMAPGVRATGVQGRLLHGDWQAERVEVNAAGYRVVLQGLQLQGFSGWSRQGASWQRVHARHVQVTTPPPPPKRVPPVSLRLPFGGSVSVAELQVDELVIDELAPVRQLKGKLQAGLEGGARHELSNLSLQWQTAQLQGQAHVQADAPFALKADAQLQPMVQPVVQPLTEPAAWQAKIVAGGELAAITVQADLSGRASGEAGAPGQAVSLQAKGTVTPYAKWPLQALQAHTQGLDLAALNPGWPRTSLQGDAVLASTGLDAPAQLTLKVENSAAGAWTQQRLPLRRGHFELALTPQQRDHLTVRAFDLELGTQAQAAGHWQGQGEWRAHRLTLQTTLQNLRPQTLHAQAPDATVQGRIDVELDHLPSPAGQAAPAGTSPQLTLKADLNGQHKELNAPLSLRAALKASTGLLEVESLQAALGAARAEATLRAEAQGSAWRLASQGKLNDFNPLPWLPLPAASPWRQGTHRFNGQWDAQLDLAAAGPPRNTLLQRLLASQGQAKLVLNESLLAGVGLSGVAELQASPGQPAKLSTELRAAGNQFSLQLAAPLKGGPAQMTGQVAAPALQALATWAPFLPEGAARAYWPRQGQLEGQWQAEGQWPKLNTKGQLQLRDVALGTGAQAVQLQAGQLQWEVDAAAADPRLQASLNLTGLRQGEQRLQQAQATLQGTLAQHQWQANTLWPGQVRADVLTWLGLPPQTAGTQLQAQGQGGWQQADMRWRGQMNQLAAGPWDGRMPAAANGDWLQAESIPLSLQFSPEGSFQRAQAGAGRALLAKQWRLVWEDVWFEPRAGLSAGALKARIEPFAALPFLQRAQPQMGWVGDLQLGAQIELRAAERFEADVVLQRTGGDLALRDGGTEQPLGLSELRASLNARDGTWSFTQAFAGQYLGEAAGALVVNTGAERRWPTADSPLSGVIQARVANLGVWGAWVPPGWRLGGNLTLAASFGGKLGAPEISGDLRGSQLAARNLLQGIELKNGELQLTLAGPRARIERFRIDAGSGHLDITGEGDLGAKPNAQLRLKADRFQALGRVDRRLALSGEAQLQLSRELIQLRGRLAVDDGLFDFSQTNAPSLDDDVRVTGARSAESAASANGNGGGNGVPAPSAQARKTDLSVQINLGDKLRLRGRGLDTLLRGQLVFNNPGGVPSLRGTVQAESGTYIAYGQRMDIARGQVFFEGSVANPRLDVLALRSNMDIAVGVNILGTAQRPIVRLYSDPEMSEAAKLSWLMLGRAPDGLGNADMALLQSAALALLAGEDEGVTDRVIKQLGLDSLSVRQSDGDTRDTVISLGKQLSRRWYVGYERGVNATSGTWQLIYRIAQRFTLRLQSGTDNAADLIWTWRSTEAR